MKKKVKIIAKNIAKKITKKENINNNNNKINNIKIINLLFTILIMTL